MQNFYIKSQAWVLDANVKEGPQYYLVGVVEEEGDTKQVLPDELINIEEKE